MTKIYQFIAVFFLSTTLLLLLMYNYTSNKLERTESQKKQLSIEVKSYKTQLEKEHNDKVELNSKYKQLEAKAKADSGFNWYADIANSPVIVELQNK